MEIKIEDLKEGDEILIPSQRKLKYLKVLRVPVFKGTRNSHYHGDIKLYKNAYCTTNRENIIYKSNIYTNYKGDPHEWHDKKYHLTPENHNWKGYVNLNFKQIWLIKREKQ